MTSNGMKGSDWKNEGTDTQTNGWNNVKTMRKKTHLARRVIGLKKAFFSNRKRARKKRGGKWSRTHETVFNRWRNESSQTYFGFEKITLLSNSKARAKKKGESCTWKNRFSAIALVRREGKKELCGCLSACMLQRLLYQYGHNSIVIGCSSVMCTIG